MRRTQQDEPLPGVSSPDRFVAPPRPALTRRAFGTLGLAAAVGVCLAPHAYAEEEAEAAATKATGGGLSGALLLPEDDVPLGYMALSSAQDASTALDALGRGLALAPYPDGGASLTQTFEIVAAEGGGVRIRSAYTGGWLVASGDVAGSRVCLSQGDEHDASGRDVWSATGGTAATFVCATNGLALTLVLGSLELARPNDLVTQTWNLSPVVPVVEDGWYLLKPGCAPQMRLQLLKADATLTKEVEATLAKEAEATLTKETEQRAEYDQRFELKHAGATVSLRTRNDEYLAPSETGGVTGSNAPYSWRVGFACAGRISLGDGGEQLAVEESAVVLEPADGTIGQSWSLAAVKKPPNPDRDEAGWDFDDPDYVEKMRERAQENGSQTDYYITVDCDWPCRDIVFHKEEDYWVAIAGWYANQGRITELGGSRSIPGVFAITHKMESLWENGTGAWWSCWFDCVGNPETGVWTDYYPGYEDGQGFHTEAYYEIPGYDEAGCSGLPEEHARWIYDEIPLGTAVDVCGNATGID